MNFYNKILFFYVITIIELLERNRQIIALRGSRRISIGASRARHFRYHFYHLDHISFGTTIRRSSINWPIQRITYGYPILDNVTDYPPKNNDTETPSYLVISETFKKRSKFLSFFFKVNQKKLKILNKEINYSSKFYDCLFPNSTIALKCLESIERLILDKNVYYRSVLTDGCCCENRYTQEPNCCIVSLNDETDRASMQR